ncbi:MAG: sigma-70 family RNA polymerase sigma factor [Terriglobia bacterium]
MRSATAEVTIPGPIDAVERLFRAHHALVFRAAYRITGDLTDAEDVLQTVFLRVIGRDGAAPPFENSERYLRRAAINAALDVVRARRVSASAPLPDSLPARGESEREELRECLRRSLASLSRQAAEIFALRFLEGYSNPEIARLLGVSQVWVAVTVHRARRRLQKEIRAYIGGKS